MNIIQKLRGEKPPVLSQVKITRQTRARTPDGEIIDVAPGDVLKLEKHECDALVAASAADRVFSSEERAELERIRGLVPPPHDPRPMPEAWAKLPACFSSWWTLAERLRCLRGRLVEIEACVVRGHGLTDEEISWMRTDIEAQGGEAGQRAKLIDGWIQKFSGRIRVMTDENELRDIGRLRGALQRQGEAIDSFLDENREAMIRLHFECGAELRKAHERMGATSRELADTGFAIFKTRVAALGLEDWKVAELFAGSTDKLKYSHPVGNPPNLRFGWAEESGERADYIDLAVPAIASILPRYQAEADRLAALLKTARAELKKATKGTAEPPALPS